jgi:REP element-mobilizing transposase RayT
MSSPSDRRYNGYRPDTLRLDEWDYRRPAWYFVTICTADRRPYFGRVRGGIVGLSPAGCIAAQEWRRTPSVRPYVRLGAWIVMPNHVHGLIGITPESPARDDITGTDAPNRDGSHAAGDGGNPDAVDASRRDASTPGTERNPRTDENNDTPDEFRLRAHSLGAIVGQYKSVCTKRIRSTCRPDFGWQSRYYDRIVHTRRAWTAVRRYIHQNPASWAGDRHRPSA